MEPRRPGPKNLRNPPHWKGVEVVSHSGYLDAAGATWRDEFPRARDTAAAFLDKWSSGHIVLRILPRPTRVDE